MAPRWFRAIGKLLMRRAKRKNTFAYYAIDSDDDGDDDDGRSSPSLNHTHADWTHVPEGSRVRTSYFDIPVSPQKRARSSSLPPPLPSFVSDESATPSYDPTAHPGDLDYIYHQLQELDKTSAPRKRTAGVRAHLAYDLYVY